MTKYIRLNRIVIFLTLVTLITRIFSPYYLSAEG